MSLHDGSAAGALLDHEQADWLEIETGQIVALRRRASAGEPGLALIGECVDTCG